MLVEVLDVMIPARFLKPSRYDRLLKYLQGRKKDLAGKLYSLSKLDYLLSRCKV